MTVSSHLATNVVMTLTDYLATNEISLGEFARRIGARNARTVQRYTRHGRVPSGSMMAAIVEATKGDVQPADFVPAMHPAE